MSASSELVSLCRSQVSLLSQIGASLSVVYLTEETIEAGEVQTKLIPIVVYPEATGWETSSALTLVPSELVENDVPLLSSGASFSTYSLADLEQFEENCSSTNLSHSLQLSTQVVLPLMHEEVLMGLLVTSREDRPWNVHERGEIERVAQTLALASRLDQRREWYEHQLTKQQDLIETQRDLLDTLLHQLRNPLTALRTFGKLLIRRFAPADANRTVAENIVRESDRIQDLLKQFEQVIDLTPTEVSSPKLLSPPVLSEQRLQATQNTPVLLPNISDHIELCAVVDILQPLLDSASAIAQERNLDLKFDIPANLPLVKAHRMALREVLSNLLDNALKYTPSGGQIRIQVAQEDLQGISISDTGPGIPQQDLQHMFERHYRGVQAQSQIPGTGLGLAIAKDLVEQMQGKIEIFSPAKDVFSSAYHGLGTTVIVWLHTAK